MLGYEERCRATTYECLETCREPMMIVEFVKGTRPMLKTAGSELQTAESSEDGEPCRPRETYLAQRQS